MCYFLEELIDGLCILGVYEKIKENFKEFLKCLCFFDIFLMVVMVDVLFYIEYVELRLNCYVV